MLHLVPPTLGCSNLNPLSKPFAPRLSGSSEPTSPTGGMTGAGGPPFFLNLNNNNNAFVSKYPPPPYPGVDVTTLPPPLPPQSGYGPIGSPCEKPTVLRSDQFGLRGLWRNIQDTHRTRIRPRMAHEPFETTVMSREDLGFSDEVIRFHGPRLLPHFESPFSSKLNTLYLDYDVPDEYRTAWKLSGCLKGKWSHYLPTELLFFLFYTAVGDILQLEAAAKLFERGWRFYKERGVWLSRKPNCRPEYESMTEQFGEYQYFDVQSWERKSGSFKFKLEDLATKVQLPRGPFPMANGFNVYPPQPPKPVGWPPRREMGKSAAPWHHGFVPPYNAYYSTVV